MHSKILSRKVTGHISPYGKYVYFRVNILCIGEFHWTSVYIFTTHTGIVIYAKVLKCCNIVLLKFSTHFVQLQLQKRLRL